MSTYFMMQLTRVSYRKLYIVENLLTCLVKEGTVIAQIKCQHEMCMHAGPKQIEIQYAAFGLVIIQLVPMSKIYSLLMPKLYLPVSTINYLIFYQ